MDQKDLLSAAASDLRSVLPSLSSSNMRMGERVEEALRHLTGERIDAVAAREALQEVERYMLQTEPASEQGENDRLLHIVRGADQKLTAALSAGHYSEG